MVDHLLRSLILCCSILQIPPCRSPQAMGALASLHSHIILPVFTVTILFSALWIRKGYSAVANNPPNLSGLMQQMLLLPHSLMEVERAPSIL